MTLATGYLGAGDVATALLVLERADEADSHQSELQNLRGVALVRAGQPDEALAAFNKALTIESSNSRARLNLAAHYAFYGYADKARAELKRAGVAPNPTGDVGEHPELGALKSLGAGK
jgi:Flp pilus assembly protein TadD